MIKPPFQYLQPKCKNGGTLTVYKVVIIVGFDKMDRGVIVFYYEEF